MTREEKIELLEKEKAYMIGHGDLWDVDMEAFDMAIEALKQEIGLDRDCEHCSKTQGSLGCCDTVSNKWVYSCKEGQREYLLNKIKAEIESLPKTYPFVNHFDMYVKVSDVKRIIDKYKAESEDKE